MIKKIRVFWNWLGDASLRLILLIGMIVVFSSGVYLSWRHTLHMAMKHGFTPDEALIYTILVETLLAVAEIVVIFRATMSKTIHMSVYVGVGLSAIINLVGNVSSFWSVSKWGVVLGASITAITAIAVWIFATALQTNTDVTTTSKTADRQETDIDKSTSGSEPDSLADIANKLKTMGIVGTVLARSDSQTDDETSSQDSTTTNIDKTTKTNTSDATTQTDTQDNDKTDNKTRQMLDKATQTDTQDKTATNRQTSDITTRLTSKTKTRSTKDAKTSKTKLSVIKGSQTNDKDELARQKAIDYFNQTGKFPSYRQLGEMAGMSKDKAGEIIKSLKQKVG